MQIHVKNSPNGRVFHYDSPVLKQRTSFWPHWGMMNVIRADGQFERIGFDVFEQRIQGLYGILTGHASKPEYADERNELHRLVQAMEAALKLGLSQGDALNPEQFSAMTSGAAPTRVAIARPGKVMAYRPELAPELPPPRATRIEVPRS